MKRMTYFVMALALVLGFTQCKKEQLNDQNDNGNLVPITLTVNGGNNNSRAEVDPTPEGYDYATVEFETGDVIYVGYNNRFVGTLTYSGTAFNGSVNITDEDMAEAYGDSLHFYFLGGVGFTPTIDETNKTATVNISDQSSKYPVISYAPSEQPFTGGGSYSAKLQNKISIMKFNVNTNSTAVICITGMNNEVTVNFNAENEDERFEYGMNADDGGLIKMPAKDAQGATWAIVLPQPELAAGGIGTAYTEDTENQSNCYLGSRPSIPAISANQYIVSVEEEPISMTMNTPRYIDLASNPGYTAKNGQVLYGVTSSPISITAGATVTLAGVNITNSSSTSGAINCNGSGRTTLVLSGENFATTSNCDGAGIRVHQDGTLVIRGDGSLTATGGYGGAGIGSGYADCGNIEIQGGNITATGGTNASGIGSGNKLCGSITINGGHVEATGGSNAAGISTDASITINNGHVEATGTGVAAGISSGNIDFDAGECAISITGGTVIAQGGSTTNYGGGAGIGSGSSPLKSNIIISGGNVSATGGKNSAGIGCGQANVNADIIISGGTIYAKGTDASSIGPSFNNAHNGDIVITSEVQSITAEITSTKAKCIGACPRYRTYSYSVTIDGHTYSTNDTGTFDPVGNDLGNTHAFTGTYDSGTKTYTLTHN